MRWHIAPCLRLSQKGRQLEMLFRVCFFFFLLRSLLKSTLSGAQKTKRRKTEQKRTLSNGWEWSIFVYKWKHIIQSLRQDDCNKSVRRLLGFIHCPGPHSLTHTQLRERLFIRFLLHALRLRNMLRKACWLRWMHCDISLEPYRVAQYDIITVSLLLRTFQSASRRRFMSLLSQIWESSEKVSCEWFPGWDDGLVEAKNEKTKHRNSIWWRFHHHSDHTLFLFSRAHWFMADCSIKAIIGVVEKPSARAMGNVVFVPHSCLSLSRQMIHSLINLISSYCRWR